ncbi:efflux transporter outer membrane subunit [Pararobbsia silviterrae]|uniref:Efflux transporter outer membrane subunit n=1 Tax=Pararobbsia silviterrae TaxID=1792498 RepID=A0A494XMY6_9BURK|nr:efflux transporter outer membrane subunit [Pararobbsia silviterrae]
MGAALTVPVAASLVSLLAGCSLAPVYQAPVVNVPTQFKEQAPWGKAAPADRLSRGDWWALAHDAVLSGLEAQVDKANPDLAAALARYDESSAYLAQTQARQYPNVGLGASVTNNRQSDTRPLRSSTQPSEYGADTLGVELDYDFDLWGKIRNEVVASKDLAQASADDMESVRLSLHARLADAYFSLRGDDAQLRLLRDSEAAYSRALAIATHRFQGGIAPAEDMTRASTSLYTVRAQISDVEGQRALNEHAIASLVGVPASNFSISPDPAPLNFDAIPVDVPSTLLERRPDIAAAERRVAASNAAIGIARAAFFPDLTISPIIGFQSTGASSWLTAPNLFWTIGPALTQTLFDAGAHEAKLTAARAKLDESAAIYRATVLHAFQQVEDNLALLGKLRDEARSQDLAVSNARRTLELALDQYQAGAVSYLDVFDAQTAALDTARSAIDVRTRYLHASVGLVRALGGGWSATPEAAQSPRPNDTRQGMTHDADVATAGQTGMEVSQR